jgi:hypothetical protein
MVAQATSSLEDVIGDVRTADNGYWATAGSRTPWLYPRGESFGIDSFALGRYEEGLRFDLSTGPSLDAFRAASDRLSIALMNRVVMHFLLEFLDQWDERSDQQFSRPRALVAPGDQRSRPLLLLLDPEQQDRAPRPRIDLMDRLGRNLPDFLTTDRIAHIRENYAQDPLEQYLLLLLGEAGPQEIMRLFVLIQPEIVSLPLPRMEAICVPSPALVIDAGADRSTAGILCTDTHGTIGITACLHGTGPVGTAVTVGTMRCTVAATDTVQDIVFIPLPQDAGISPAKGKGGILSAKAPGMAENVSFDGASSGLVQTRIVSYDAGLLRKRKSLQLKLQTPADTNSGDSGAALIRDDDTVMGFAFERTAFGEYPEMTDWIWAANALDALGLTPIK